MDAPEIINPEPTANTPAPESILPEGNGSNAPIPASPEASPQGTPSPETKDASEKKWFDDYINSLPEADREKELKTLERFKDTSELIKAFKETKKMISKGEHKKPLPENHTQEELAEYRKAFGVPEKPEAYSENFKEGYIFPEHDKPLLDSFKEAMHKVHAPQSVYEAAVNAYKDIQDKQIQAYDNMVYEADAKAKQALKEQHGLNFERHNNHIVSVLQSTMGDDWKSFREAKMPDGTHLLSKPEVFNGLLKLAQDLNPIPTLTGHTSADSFVNRKNEIEQIMRTNIHAYQKNPTMQAEYLNILQAEEKMKKK